MVVVVVGGGVVVVVVVGVVAGGSGEVRGLRVRVGGVGVAGAFYDELPWTSNDRLASNVCRRTCGFCGELSLRCCYRVVVVVVVAGRRVRFEGRE